MILSDVDLRTHIAKGRIVIEPFDEDIIRENGVDLRLGNEGNHLLYTQMKEF